MCGTVHLSVYEHIVLCGDPFCTCISYRFSMGTSTFKFTVVPPFIDFKLSSGPCSVYNWHIALLMVHSYTKSFCGWKENDLLLLIISVKTVLKPCMSKVLLSVCSMAENLNGLSSCLYISLYVFVCVYTKLKCFAVQHIVQSNAACCMIPWYYNVFLVEYMLGNFNHWSKNWKKKL